MDPAYSELVSTNPLDNILVLVACYSALILAVIEVAKRICELTPSKRDDEIVGIIDSVVRKGLDMIAGRGHGRPNDPGLVDRSERDEQDS